MLATSRMWRYTRWMFAVWWRQLQVQVGAPAGDRRLRRAMPFQTTFPHERLHHVRVFSSRPIRRRPCLIRRSRAVAAVLAGAVVVAAEAVARGGGGAGAWGGWGGGRGAGVVAVAAGLRVGAGARAAEVPEAVVRVAPVQVVVRAAAVKAAREAAAREAALAGAVPILSLTITIRPTTSRVQLCRHFHLRLRPTNRSWRRWRKERAGSRC